ncbi:hypothetical protein AAHB57_28945 [Bacillus cereus]
MLKKLGIGLVTSLILLSTNGIADASTNSVHVKNEMISKGQKSAVTVGVLVNLELRKELQQSIQ